MNPYASNSVPGGEAIPLQNRVNPFAEIFATPVRFYITDFDYSQAGFSEHDFNQLIASGRVVVTNAG